MAGLVAPGFARALCGVGRDDRDTGRAGVGLEWDEGAVARYAMAG